MRSPSAVALILAAAKITKTPSFHSLENFLLHTAASPELGAVGHKKDLHMLLAQESTNPCANP
jgi:hypothetical protein